MIYSFTGDEDEHRDFQLTQETQCLNDLTCLTAKKRDIADIWSDIFTYLRPMLRIYKN